MDTLLHVSARHQIGVYISPDQDARTGTFRIQRYQRFRDHPLIAVEGTGRHLIKVSRWVDPGSSEPTYSITRRTTGGDTVYTQGFPYSPRAIPDHEVSSELLRIAERLGGDPARALEVAQAGLYVPPWYPPVSVVLVGPEGWVWVRREAPRADRPRRWDIINPGGERVGALFLPLNLEVRAVHGLTGWAIEAGDGAGAHLWAVQARLAPEIHVPDTDANSGAAGPKPVDGFATGLRARCARRPRPMRRPPVPSSRGFRS